jgi:hypothetical protein
VYVLHQVLQVVLKADMFCDLQMIAFSGYVPTTAFSEPQLTENDCRTIGNGGHLFSPFSVAEN